MRRSFLHHNWRNAPRYDYESMCSICGVACPRSKLVKKADGLFYCPDDLPGRDRVTLSRLNAEATRDAYQGRPPYDGGGFDSRGPYTPDDRPVGSLGVFDETFDGSFN